MKAILLFICLSVLGVCGAAAETFKPAAYISDAEIEVLTKKVTNEQIVCDLFGLPYATVVVGNIDVYDRFPYLEARYYQIVSDPAWDRLLLGEMGNDLSAYDGRLDIFGGLKSPRGLSCDGLGRVYVADTGNNRVLVFKSDGEFDKLELKPVFEIAGLSKPYDVAYSDGGTPFDSDDDCLYVANTGRNEICRYELSDRNAVPGGTIGGLGSGEKRFAGPMAVTVGHRNGVNSDEVYVSDAHNSRLVLLRDTGKTLVWEGSVPHSMGPVTSLDTDHWGNLYAAAPQSGSVTKFTASLFRVATLGNINRPRDFHVPFANVTDHRSGERSRSGQGSGILVEEWGSNNGIRMMNLGVELTDATVTDGSGTSVRVTLTDHAAVTAEISEPGSGRVIARHDSGLMGAGLQTIRFLDDDFLAAWERGDYQLTVRARSTYDESATSEIETTVSMRHSGSPALPAQLTLLGNTPNPFNPVTTIRFVVPAGNSRSYSLRVYDVRGRLVRELAAGTIDAGPHEVQWDGSNITGGSVGSGIYLYRLEVGAERTTGKMVLLK